MREGPAVPVPRCYTLRSTRRVAGGKTRDIAQRACTIDIEILEAQMRAERKSKLQGARLAGIGVMLTGVLALLLAMFGATGADATKLDAHSAAKCKAKKSCNTTTTKPPHCGCSTTTTIALDNHGRRGHHHVGRDHHERSHYDHGRDDDLLVHVVVDFVFDVIVDHVVVDFLIVVIDVDHRCAKFLSPDDDQRHARGYHDTPVRNTPPPPDVTPQATTGILPFTGSPAVPLAAFGHRDGADRMGTRAPAPSPRADEFVQEITTKKAPATTPITKLTPTEGNQRHRRADSPAAASPIVTASASAAGSAEERQDRHHAAHDRCREVVGKEVGRRRDRCGAGELRAAGSRRRWSSVRRRERREGEPTRCADVRIATPPRSVRTSPGCPSRTRGRVLSSRGSVKTPELPLCAARAKDIVVRHHLGAASLQLRDSRPADPVHSRSCGGRGRAASAAAVREVVGHRGRVGEAAAPERQLGEPHRAEHAHDVVEIGRPECRRPRRR